MTVPIATRKAEVFLLAILFFALTGILIAECTPRQSEQFEVASIRPIANGGRPWMEFTPGGGVRAKNVTLKMLIEMAYDIRSEQISGGPEWTDSEQFSVVAKG